MLVLSTLFASFFFPAKNLDLCHHQNWASSVCHPANRIRPNAITKWEQTATMSFHEFRPPFIMAFGRIPFAGWQNSEAQFDDDTNLNFSFPCRLHPFPCKYLGIPLSPGRLKKSDLHPLVDHVVAALPTWKSRMLNKAGKLILVKVKLAAIPIHTAMALSPWVIKEIEQRCRAFLWQGMETTSGGTAFWPGRTYVVQWCWGSGNPEHAAVWICFTTSLALDGKTGRPKNLVLSAGQC